MQVLWTAGAAEHWLRRSSAGKDFQVLEADSGTGSITAPWPDQAKCPLLGTCETMPGELSGFGSHSRKRKGKKLGEFHKGTPG